MEDYDAFARNILTIGKSYWMPKEIKDSLKFIELAGFYPTEEKGLKANFGSGLATNWLMPLPKTTFEEFNKNLHNLALTIDKWLKEHSAIHIDLKLEEPDRF